MSFLAALGFLTTWPVLGKRIIPDKTLGRAVVYFPLVGLVIGLVLAGAGFVINIILPRMLTSVLVIAGGLLITGALHVDGLADTCDAMAGNKTVEERHRIMKDSRNGAFGMAGVGVLLLAKFAALVSLPDGAWFTILILAIIISRWAMTYAIFTFPYALTSGLGVVFKKNTHWPQLLIASLIAFIIMVGLVPLVGLMGLVLWVVVWLIVFCTGVYFNHKFHGLTGDNYGALCEISEISVLILGVVWANLGLI
ncbi:adenosylcobinamide-GDP ribazoletransferase [Chloroflexota bacterium]